MLRINETNKYGGDKLALLGLLIIAVLMARFIVDRRTAIVLSAPVDVLTVSRLRKG